jgi:hypothetical protein
VAGEQKESLIIQALNAATGETRWRAPRPKRVSWSTPLVVVHDHLTQILQNGGGTLSSYAATDGRLL